jgi:hypothetical protein
MPVRRERFTDTDLGPARSCIGLGPHPELHRLLHASDLTPDEQRAVVTAWLAANEPVPILRASLRGHGLAE